MSARGTMTARSPAESVAAMKISLDLSSMPELIHQFRREVVRMLRERAERAVHPEAAKELREAADEFDAGLHLEEGWEEDLDGED